VVFSLFPSSTRDYMVWSKRRQVRPWWVSVAPSDCVGWDVIVEKSLSLCMPSFLFKVQFWKASRLVKRRVR
jgi:hypothetical protein